MTEEIYTLGAWRVKDGKQSEFIEAWQALGRYFRGLPHPPGKGTLLQSVDEPPGRMRLHATQLLMSRAAIRRTERRKRSAR